MKIGKALILPIIASMLLGIVFTTGPVGAPSTTVGVEPDSIINPGLGSGSWFTVEIWVRDVTDLAAVEFKLAYNTMILDVTKVKYGGIFGPDFPPDYFPLINVTYESAGYLHYGIMEMFGQPGFTGPGIVATINFTVVVDVGESALKLYDTKLGNSQAQPITHTAIDGYFRNTLEEIEYSATLAKRKAWPEHHNYTLGLDEDSCNDLFAIVYNDGAAATWVKVVFSIVSSSGSPMGDFSTTKMWLSAGAMYGHEKEARYMFRLIIGGGGAHIPAEAGKYYVSAACLVDADADGVPETPMGKPKSFSFNIFQQI